MDCECEAAHPMTVNTQFSIAVPQVVVVISGLHQEEGMRQEARSYCSNQSEIPIEVECLNIVLVNFLLSFCILFRLQNYQYRNTTTSTVQCTIAPSLDLPRGRNDLQLTHACYQIAHVWCNTSFRRGVRKQ